MPIAINCPFFSWEEVTKCKLHCEAGVMKFPSVEARIEYLDKYCADICGYKDCTLAANLLNDYDRRDVPVKPNNQEIRALAKDCDVRFWQIADEMRISERTLTRIMQRPLNRQKAKQIREIIQKLM